MSSMTEMNKCIAELRQLAEDIIKDGDYITQPGKPWYASAKRLRMATNQMTKVGKDFRKISVQAEKDHKAKK